MPISEKGDDGVTVESSLRVPQHLSIAFSTAADAYCSAAYAVAPQSLPSKVQVRVYSLNFEAELTPSLGSAVGSASVS